jgi:hypothetical protein
VSEDTKLDHPVVSRDRQFGRASQIFVVDLKCTEGRVESRTPIDQSVTAVNQTVLMQAYEGFCDSLGAVLVHLVIVSYYIPERVRGGTNVP